MEKRMRGKVLKTKQDTANFKNKMAEVFFFFF